MADNVTVDNVDLTDYAVATDDDGTAHHQYVKLEFGADNTQTKVSAANPLPITGTALVIASAPAVTGTVAVSSLPTATVTGTVAINVLPGGANTLGTVIVGGSLPAGVSTIGTVAPVGTFTTKETRSTSASPARVSASASVVGLANLNTSRLGLSIANDSPGDLYVKLGTSAGTADYNVRLVQYAYYEVPFGYTGTITGIWATAPS